MKYLLFSRYIQLHEHDMDDRLIDLMEDKMHCECGAEHAVNLSLTEVVCSNPVCKYKVAKRITQFARDMQILGIGQSLAERIAEKFEIDNPLYLLSYDPSIDGTLGDGVSEEQSYKIYNQIKERNIPRPLWEFLRMANIPKIRDNAQKIMNGVESFSQLQQHLQTGGIPFIHKQLGLSSNSSEQSVMAVTIYNNLIHSIESLVSVEEDLNVYSPSHEISVVISKHVDGFTTKESFIEYVNTKYHGKVYLKKLNSVSKNIDYLVCDDIGGGTNKVRKAQQYGINVIGSVDLLSYLERTYG